jgi:enamine deaminase RidA (YjgF/YER057c/UK114 family)
LINPEGISGSPSYSHGVEVQGPARWLAIAGQVGRASDGSIPDGIEAQAEIAWSNIDRVLRDAGMAMADLASVTVYLVNRDDTAGFDAVRARWLGGMRPASTKLYISGLAHPKMLCEVQAFAAKPV